MAEHTILLPDAMRGRALRSIVWDNQAGTVEGEHYEIAWIRDVIRQSAEGPVTVGDPGGTWDLRDPGHDPAEFLVLLGLCFRGHPLPSTILASLPPIFDGVSLPSADPGEELWGVDPDTGELVELT